MEATTMLNKLQNRIHEWIAVNYQGNDYSWLSQNAFTHWLSPNPLSKHEFQQLQQAKISANANMHNFMY